MNKNDYVIIKLISGEQLMATLAETPGRFEFTVKDVLVIKHVSMMGSDGVVEEKALTTKFCNYTEEDIFVLDTNKVIYCKPLKKTLHKHYLQVIETFNSDDPMDIDPEDDHFDMDFKSILH